MKRNVEFTEISDNKTYTSGDMCKVNTGGCIGCHECCSFTEGTIFLDPYDAYELSQNLNLSFQEMLGRFISLTVVDGVVTPVLMQKNNACYFLNKEGRCDIHTFRPGFCRMFPLGRIWESEDEFKYFVQVHECPNISSKIKIKSWLNIENIKEYEDFVIKWHKIIVKIRESFNEDPERCNLLNTAMLHAFFFNGFAGDFFTSFNINLDSFRKNFFNQD